MGYTVTPLVSDHSFAPQHYKAWGNAFNDAVVFVTNRPDLEGFIEFFSEDHQTHVYVIPFSHGRLLTSKGQMRHDGSSTPVTDGCCDERTHICVLRETPDGYACAECLYS